MNRFGRNYSLAAARPLPEPSNAFDRLEALDRELEEEEVFVHEALLAADLAVFEWDLRNDVVKGNYRLREILRCGDSIKDHKGIERFIEHIHLDDRERVQVALEKAIETGETYQVRYHVAHAEGEEPRHFIARGKVRYDSKDQPCSFYGVIMESCGDCPRRNISLATHEHQ